MEAQAEGSLQEGGGTVGQALRTGRVREGRVGARPGQEGPVGGASRAVLKTGLVCAGGW